MQSIDAVVHVAHNRIVAAANSSAFKVGGATAIGWQYWGSDGSTTQADLTAVSIELQGRVVQRENGAPAGTTLLTGPWIKIGDTMTGVSGDLIRDVTPIAVTEVRIVVNSMTLGSAADLNALIRLS